MEIENGKLSAMAKMLIVRTCLDRFGIENIFVRLNPVQVRLFVELKLLLREICETIFTNRNPTSIVLILVLIFCEWNRTRSRGQLRRE